MKKSQHYFELKYSFGLLIAYAFLVFSCAIIFGIHNITEFSYYSKYDTISYLQAAKDLAIGIPNPYRCVGYSLVIALFQFFFDNTSTCFTLIACLQICLQFLSFLIIFRILCNYYSQKQSLLITLFMMLNVSFIIFSFHIMTETFFIFFMMSSFYSLFKFFLRQKTNQIFLAFLCTCVATLFRPGLLYWTLLFGFAAMVYFLFQNQKTIRISILITIGMLTIGVQSYWMHSKFGSYKISFIDDITMYSYMHTAIVANQQNIDLQTCMNARNHILNNKMDLLEEDKKYVYQHELVHLERKEIFKKDKMKFLAAFASNLFSNFHTGNTFIRDIPNEWVKSVLLKNKMFDLTRIYNMIFVILLQLACLGVTIVLLLKKINLNRHFIFAFILLLYCQYSFLTSGISFFQGDRFNIIWMPMALVGIGILLKNKTQDSI